MISNIRKNIMGTVSFDGLFPGMRKAQDFIVYPFHAGNDTSRAKIQSDTRIGSIDLRTGVVILSKPRAGGAYGVHLDGAPYNSTLWAEDLLMFKAQIAASASGKAGTNGIMYTDNSGALEVFQ